jgi:RimJ/RimL family protein N-acetyltransferase
MLNIKILIIILKVKFMLLKYKSLIIRNATIADSEVLAKWWNDGKVMAHAGFPNGLGITAENIAEDLKRDSDFKGRRFIIENEGNHIGEMSYYNKGDNKAEIGIKICDFSKQEKGLGKIILSLFITELFSMGYEKIILDTNLNNARAQHVYEQLGFRKVRTNIDAWKDQLGVNQSSVDYELNKGELISFIL